MPQKVEIEVINSNKTKQMNTKIKGISLVFTILGLTLAGVASAALVNYLSNKVTSVTSIASPVSMSINEGRDGSDSGNNSIAFSTFGGSDFVFTTVAKNNANNKVEGYRVILAEAPAGKPFTGHEVMSVAMENANFASTTITDTLYVYGSDGTHAKLADWVGNSQKIIITNDDTVGLDAGEIDWNAITIQVNQAIAPGSYVIRSMFVNDLAAYRLSELGI